MAAVKVKVYEIAKELGVDPQQLVEVVQRLGVDIKNSMSVLGTEEVRTVREYYKKQRPMTKSKAPTVKETSAPAKPQSSMTEKRVGATVIRRRAKAAEPEPAPPPAVEEPIEEVAESVEAQPDVTAVEATTETAEIPEQVVEAAPEAPQPKAEPQKRKFFPSIIKKVATEQYLGEKVGPKVEKKEKPKTVEAKKPATATTTTTTPAAGALGPKRVKEIELVTTDPRAAETGKKRLMERQSGTFNSSDYLKREVVHATKKKRSQMTRPTLKTIITTAAQHKRVVEMGDKITVSEIAKEMSQKASAVITKLMAMGVTATMNESIDHDTASLLAHEFGYEVKQKVFKEEDYIPKVDLTPEKLLPRPPVVTIMGHVDHGKTSLLDALRKTSVAAGEAGGITQHIGAYTVQLPKGKITFVDTPGHEAFTAMRARGAKVTDIVVLVVSAVDGVMPQTLESISHAQAANVPIIVAVNKIDLPEANPDRVKQTLAGHNLNPEEWGGDTIYVNVSAKTGKNLDKLLESILLQAEMGELKANYDAPARGVVVESKLDKNRGPVATILVQHGKLTNGSLIVSGTTFGKVRAMTNSAGAKVEEALPSDPVEILGLPEVPAVGDEIFQAENEKRAKELIGERTNLTKMSAPGAKSKMTLEEMLALPEGEKELRIVLRTDVQGSVEALKEAISKQPQDKVKLKVLFSGSGGVTESDVNLAAASGAVIMGFNIRPELKAQKLAETEKVTIRTYNIIYDLLEDVKKLASGLLDKVVKEKVIGRAEVRDIFHIPKVGTIAGSAILDGKVTRGCFLRLLRDSRVVYEGKISSLKRFKEDVREVSQGYECGIGLENFNDLKQGDQFEAFIKEESQGAL